MNGDRWRRIEELYHAARLLRVAWATSIARTTDRRPVGGRARARHRPPHPTANPEDRLVDVGGLQITKNLVFDARLTRPAGS